jgi:hypothetical protein
MGAFPDTIVNNGLDGRLPATPHLSAHTAFSDTGANEVSGGAYAREVMAMDAATGRTADNTAAESLSIPASTTVQFVGIFDALTGGNFITMMPLGSTKALVGMATDAAENGAPADTLWVAGHGMAQDERVAFFSVDGTLPTGITEGVLYYVIGTPTTNSLQVSATEDGAALAITAAGSFIMSDAVPETYASAGTLELALGDLDLVGLA